MVLVQTATDGVLGERASGGNRGRSVRAFTKEAAVMRDRQRACAELKARLQYGIADERPDAIAVDTTVTACS